MQIRIEDILLLTCTPCLKKIPKTEHAERDEQCKKTADDRERGSQYDEQIYEQYDELYIQRNIMHIECSGCQMHAFLTWIHIPSPVNSG